MRVWLKRIGVICLIPIVLLLLVSLLLYVPPIQKYIAGRAMRYVSESTGIDVRFERVRLSFPLNLSVRNALVSTAGSDTLAFLDRLKVDIGFRELFDGNIYVKEVHLESLELNTGTLLDGISIKGHVGKIRLSADSVSLAVERALLNEISISDADIDLFLCDTTVADTAGTAVNWCIDLKKIELANVSFKCRMPCDSVFLGLNVDNAMLSDGFVDLGEEIYSASVFHAGINELYYGTDLNEAAPGLDVSHIKLTEAGLTLDSLLYAGGMNISVNIKEFFAEERSGLSVKSLTGRIEADSTQIKIPSLLGRTEFSDIRLQGYVPWSSINSKKHEGRFALEVEASIDKKDALIVTGNTSDVFGRYYPDSVFSFKAQVAGDIANDMSCIVDAALPGAFKLNLTGELSSIKDEKKRSGKVDYFLETLDMDFVAGLLPSSVQQRFRMPDSLEFNGYLTIDNGVYSTETILKESLGEVMFTGSYDILGKNYDAYLKVDNLEPVHFMPDDSVMLLNAFVRAKGKGTDFFKYTTWAELEGKVSEVHYGGTSVSDVSLTVDLRGSHLLAELVSAFPLAKGNISIDCDITDEKAKGMLIVGVDSLDLYGLKMTETPFATSFQIFSEIESDLDKVHALDITLGNWSLFFENQIVEPKMLTLGFRSDADTTRATFYAGDLSVMLSGSSDAETLLDKLTYLSKETMMQLKSDTAVDIHALRPYFPDMTVQIKAERDNPVYNFLQEDNIFFDGFHIDADISPENGLSARGALIALVKDTLKIDTVRFDVWQDTLGILYDASIIKKRFRNQEAFVANANGYIHKDNADIMLSFVNSKGESGLNLGVNVKIVPAGFDFHFYPENPVIAFIPFTINKDNYFHFKSLKEMTADLKMEGPSNASLWIHSGDSDEQMKEILIELSQINLKSVSDGFSDIPSLRGILNSTFRYEPMDNSFMVIADGNIEDFYYESSRVGDLLLNATYMPMDKGTHQVDMHVFHDFSEIASLSVLYKEGRYENQIDGIISIEKLPLNLIDGMAPNAMARLDGFMYGSFRVGGTDKKPLVNGSMHIENGSAFIVPASTKLTFDDKPVKMINNIVRFDNYRIYAQKDNPFVIDGIIDATDINRATVDMTMTATNMQLIDSRRTRESIAFGRLYVNMSSTLRGTLQSLRMRGNMRILGNTNMTYVMLDSPLEVQDNFNNLVTFTYLADTLPRRARGMAGMVRGTGSVATVSGMDILMNVSIDPVVRLRVELDDQQNNYIDLRGGGDLSLRYTVDGDMTLNGRYTLSDGTIRYSIPVIPLTNFSVRNGSYVDWSGNMMNPYLNIAAYTRARSSVNLDGQSRMVDFNAGIQLRDNLEDVSVQFLLEAPSDAVLQNQLTAMGEEERGKQAASLLVTGVYLASGSMGNMDVGLALSSLLQRELKNILGSLFGDVPFSIDVNSYEGMQGDAGQRVDYIARFYKGFYNDRINTALGLRYSTDDPVYGNRFILDDVSAGYLLDMDGSRSVNLFRSKDYENVFEGEIAKIGASFSIRRKVKSFKDFFIFRKKEPAIIRRAEGAAIKPEEEAENEENNEEVENNEESGNEEVNENNENNEEIENEEVNEKNEEGETKEEKPV